MEVITSLLEESAEARLDELDLTDKLLVELPNDDLALVAGGPAISNLGD